MWGVLAVVKSGERLLKRDGNVNAWSGDLSGSGHVGFSDKPIADFTCFRNCMSAFTSHWHSSLGPVCGANARSSCLTSDGFAPERPFFASARHRYVPLQKCPPWTHIGERSRHLSEHAPLRPPASRSTCPKPRTSARPGSPRDPAWRRLSAPHRSE